MTLRPERANASRGAAWLVGLAASLGACATPGPQVLSPGDPHVRSALERVARQAERRVNLSAFGQLRMSARGDRGRVEQVIVAERPDRLRLESLDPLGQTVALLVSDGRRFGWYDGRRLESGPVSASLLRDRLGLELAPREAVEAILAAPSAVDSTVRAAFRSRGEMVVELDAWRLRLAADGELSGLESLDAAGRTRWRAEYSGWSDVPGGRFPHDLSIEIPPARTRVRLALREIRLNAALDPRVFVLPVND